MQEAMFYRKLDDSALCMLCPNECVLKEGATGICGTRKYEDGRLFALNYGKVAALQIDPIEKKPLYNWHQGSEILSIGSYGCNLHCPFCQNHELVAHRNNGTVLTPEEVVARAMAYDLDAIAYTYNEPTVFYEMVYNTAKAAAEKGLYNVLVTNGYINQAPLKALLPYIDAMNVDLKSYSDERFRQMCGGHLTPVIEMIKTSLKFAHVEVTMLLVPELYEDIEKMPEYFEWLFEAIGDITLHLTRYFPRYRHVTPATDINWMLKVQKTARMYFSEVYLGNVY